MRRAQVDPQGKEEGPAAGLAVGPLFSAVSAQHQPQSPACCIGADSACVGLPAPNRPTVKAAVAIPIRTRRINNSLSMPHVWDRVSLGCALVPVDVDTDIVIP